MFLNKEYYRKLATNLFHVPLNTYTYAMPITRTEIFRAEITFGLQKGYSTEVIPLDDFKIKLENAQRQVDRERQIKLSGKVTPCLIIFAGQNEDSVV